MSMMQGVVFNPNTPLALRRSDVGRLARERIALRTAYTKRN
ncbi:MAG: hypothetical protein WCB68_08010 [Pyrinomonadaceae bacterium]